MQKSSTDSSLDARERDGNAEPDWDAELVTIPLERRHDSGMHASVPGLAVAILVTVPGAVLLGAGYGAFQALCAEHFANVALWVSIPFWIGVPAHLGFMWGNVRHPRWRYPVELTGLVCSLYAVYVGWLFAVLDGPGLVINPLALFSHVTDSTNHSVWIEAVPLIDLRPELPAMENYLNGLRLLEFAWIGFAGLLSLGAATPAPYCRDCSCWMDESHSLRLQYDVSDTEQARNLGDELVAGRYDTLLKLDQPLKPRARGLQVDTYSCPRCGEAHVLDVRWFRAVADERLGETAQLLQSMGGVPVVSRLQVPSSVPEYMGQLADRDAA